MRKLMATVLAVGAFWQVQAADSTWLTSLPAAEAQAKAEQKAVLMDFTGSDWCTGCIEFKKEVLDSPQFQNYAAKNLVVVEVDFPDKPLPAALRRDNADLKEKYHVRGFPTFVLLDRNGNEIGRQAGYSGEGPRSFMDKLESLKAKAQSENAFSGLRHGG